MSFGISHAGKTCFRRATAIKIQSTSQVIMRQFNLRMLNVDVVVFKGDCASAVCDKHLCSTFSKCSPESPSSYRCLCPVGASGPSCERCKYSALVLARIYNEDNQVCMYQ